MYRFVLVNILMVCALTANAQTYTDILQSRGTGSGSVKIVQSADIAAVVNGKINVPAEPKPSAKETAAAKPAATEKPAASQQKTSEKENESDEPVNVDTSKKVIKNAQKVNGYRVQVFSGGNSREDKNKAEAIGERIKRLFPDQPVYVHFYSPRWICRMGNYRTYEEAQSMLSRVKEAGYRQASLVKGTITPTD